MKARKLRESCLSRVARTLAWLPVLLCMFLVGWSYYIFTFSVCGYLLTHDEVFQGMIYLMLVHLVVVLLIWSYFSATFSSPGYPSETFKDLTKRHGDHLSTLAANIGSGTIGTIVNGPQRESMDDSEDVNERLLDPANHSPHPTSTLGGGTSFISSSSTMVESPALGGGNGGKNRKLSMSNPSPLAAYHQAITIDEEDDGLTDYNRAEYVDGSGQPQIHHRHAHTQSYQTGEYISSTENRAKNGSIAGSGGGGVSMFSNDTEDLEDNRPLGLSIRRFTVKRDGKMRYCQKCKFEKPDRTHHCSTCKRCVLKMDHHCPWLNNCVGHNNYKAFYLFVFWTAVYCVVLVACTIPVMIRVLNGPYEEEPDTSQYSWAFMILIAAIFGLCLVPFSIHHTLLVKANRTTIESFERHKYRMGSNGQVMQSRVLNVFDLGLKENFIQVFGPRWYLWLVPIRNTEGNGWTFPANDYGRNMLQHVDEEIEDPGSENYSRRSSFGAGDDRAFLSSSGSPSKTTPPHSTGGGGGGPGTSSAALSLLQYQQQQHNIQQLQYTPSRHQQQLAYNFQQRQQRRGLRRDSDEVSTISIHSNTTVEDFAVSGTASESDFAPPHATTKTAARGPSSFGRSKKSFLRAGLSASASSSSRKFVDDDDEAEDDEDEESDSDAPPTLRFFDPGMPHP